MSRNTVWTTESVNLTIEKLRRGIDQPDLSCFHDRDIELKAGNLLFKISNEESKEFEKCANDAGYFVNKYCKFLTDTGRQTVDLRPYQHEILDDLTKEEWKPKINDVGPVNRNYILMASRQIGKTTTIAAFFAWYLCFHTDRNLAILANKEKTAVEIVSKVIHVFRGLPFFLKPGIIGVGSTQMTLDNGCKLLSQATTKTAQIGFTIHVLYADEFAHIAPNIVGDFWRSVYPTLASSEISQCIISSTPAGTSNLFYEIWDKSVQNKNTFKHKRVDYWEVPGHDEEWAKEIKSNFSEEYFAQEFELQFNSDSKLLLSSDEFTFLKKIEKKYVFKDLEKTELDEELYKNLKWHPDFNPNADFNPDKDFFIISVDTGEGKTEQELKDNDYNILSIYKASPKSLVQLRKLRKDQYLIKNMFKFTQVGLYRDNINDEDISAKIAKAIIFDQFGEETTMLLLEMNFNGKYFLKIFSDHDNYYDGIVMRTYHTKPIPGTTPPPKKPGFKTGNDKTHFCLSTRKLIKLRNIIPNEEITITEFSSFGKDKKGKYKGIASHDDAAISTINISRLYEEPILEDRLYDILENMEYSEVKSYILSLLKMYEEKSEYTDEYFDSLYNNDVDNLYLPPTENEIFKQGSTFAAKYKSPPRYIKS